jgi:DNA invertase Pin-like site-specific DNA recombinase
MACLKKRSFDKTDATRQKFMRYIAIFVLYISLIYQPLIISIMAAKNKTQKQKKPEATLRLVGYARVSTDEQDVALQLEALQQQGCEREWIFVDTASGARTQRPGLEACLESLREGDVLLVWRLDRLGRSMPHLVSLVTELRERGIGFRSICDGMIDTTTASGELVFNIFSALAQFERRLIQERTRAGLSAARARGRKGGRKPINPDNPRVQMAKTMHKDKSVSIADICQTLHISRATFYRYLTLAAHNASA